MFLFEEEYDAEAFLDSPTAPVETSTVPGQKLLRLMSEYVRGEDGEERTLSRAEAEMRRLEEEGLSAGEESRERAFLVGVELKSRSGDPNAAFSFSLLASMGELAELARTAGLNVVGADSQSLLEPNPRSYIGSGKVREVRSAMKALRCQTVIVDEELSPGQQRNLEVSFGGEEAGIKVLDRTALILDIFSQHANTKEGILQVELALATYRLPRLTRLWTHLERQSGGSGKSGGVGLRGPGERQIEVDRRLLRDRINALNKELDVIRRHRQTQRKKRRKEGIPVIALVGYTNAGKSSVLNALTKAGVLSEDMLFATLDPTTRRVRLPALQVHPDVLFTDTVGFIQKLPTQLIAAFRATLEEVKEADVIVHVIDASNPNWEKQSTSVMRTLADLGVVDAADPASEYADGQAKPIVTLLNKMDRVSQKKLSPFLRLQHQRPLTVMASAKTGDGMLDFVLCVEDALRTLLSPIEVLIPFNKGELLNELHERGVCDSVTYLDSGVRVSGKAPLDLCQRLEPHSLLEVDLEVVEDDGEEDWKALAKGRHSYMAQRNRA